jgi:chromosome partitioning protein
MDTLKQEYQISANDLAQTLGITRQRLYGILKEKNLGKKKNNNSFAIYSSDVRKLFEYRNLVYKHQKIAFQCAKGGVGKTSLAYSFGIRANMYGAKVLMIDLDMQGHLTLGFANDDIVNQFKSNDLPVWADLIEGNVSSINDCIIPVTKNLDLVPSTLNNSTLESIISKNYNTIPVQKTVSKFLKEVEDNYDFIIFDCAPGFSGINTGVMSATDLIIVPAYPDRYGVDGVDTTIRELKKIKQNMELGFDIKILLNRHHATKKVAIKRAIDLQVNYPDLVLPCYIRDNAEVSNATDEGISVFERKKKSPAKEDLDTFALELMGLREE